MLNRQEVRERTNVLVLVFAIAAVVFAAAKASAEEPRVDEVTFDPGITVGPGFVIELDGSVTFDAADAEDADRIHGNDATGPFVATEEVEADPLAPPTPFGRRVHLGPDDELKGPITALTAPTTRQAEALYSWATSHSMEFLALLFAMAMVILVFQIKSDRRRTANRRVRPPQGTPRECSDLDDDVVEDDLGPPVQPHAVGGDVDPRLVEYMNRPRDPAGTNAAPFLLTRKKRGSSEATPTNGTPLN